MAVVNPSSRLTWLRSASFVSVAVWAVFGVFSCYAVYQSSVHSFAQGAGWAAGWTLLMATAVWLLAPTVLCPALALNSG
jgi:hypothetical protein